MLHAQFPEFFDLKTEYHIFTGTGKIKYIFSQNFDLPDEERLERIFKKFVDNSKVKIKSIEGIDNEGNRYRMSGD